MRWGDARSPAEAMQRDDVRQVSARRANVVIRCASWLLRRNSLIDDDVPAGADREEGCGCVRGECANGPRVAVLARAEERAGVTPQELAQQRELSLTRPTHVD